jgi:hypothetical protein
LRKSQRFFVRFSRFFHPFFHTVCAKIAGRSPGRAIAHRWRYRKIATKKIYNDSMEKIPNRNAMRFFCKKNRTPRFELQGPSDCVMKFSFRVCPFMKIDRTQPVKSENSSHDSFLRDILLWFCSFVLFLLERTFGIFYCVLWNDHQCGE